MVIAAWSGSGGKRLAGRLFHLLLDLTDDPLGLLLIAVRHQPARALRHMPPHHQDAEAENGADAEADPPAEIDGKQVGIEQRDRGERADGGADPIGAVDIEIDTATQTRRDQLIDGRIDGRIFAADPRPGDEAKDDEAPQIPRERREQHADQIDTERDEEQPLSPEAVGEIAEKQRAGHRAGQIEGCDEADLGAGEMQRLRLLKHAADGAFQGDLETIEDPGHAERDDDHRVEAAPRQPVEPGRDERCDGRRRATTAVVAFLRALQFPIPL